MPDTTRLAAFMVAALVLLLVPGPAVFFITARSLDQGRLAGVVSALGVGLGNLVHAVGAAAGLSALLASSAIMFTVVKYLGAAYLVYLGIRRLLAKAEDRPAARARRGLRRSFVDGAVVAVLNPKTAIFFVAFMPQFVSVSPGAASIWAQTLVLGLVFVIMGTATDSLYAFAAGATSGWLKGHGGSAAVASRLRRSGRFFRGGIFITLGVTTALTGGRSD